MCATKKKQMLRSTQHSMLRKMAGPRRRPEEAWVDWIQRSTRTARSLAQKAGVRMWLDTHLQNKWCWAGHVMRMHDTRLARRGLEWRDSLWWSEESEILAALRLRQPGRAHWFRWEDQLKQYALHSGWSSWQAVEQKRDASGQASEWLEHCKFSVKFFKW